jgi:hypothetical protein
MPFGHEGIPEGVDGLDVAGFGGTDEIVVLDVSCLG